MPRALLAVVLLAGAILPGCLAEDRSARAWAHDTVDEVALAEVRMSENTTRLDLDRSADRALVLATLEALHGARDAPSEVMYRSSELEAKLANGSWVRLAFSEAIDPPAADADRRITDVHAVFDGPSATLQGVLVVGNGTHAEPKATSADLAQLRDLAVEVLHLRGRAPG